MFAADLRIISDSLHHEKLDLIVLSLCARRVGGLDENVDKRDLEDEFDKMGRVKSVWVARSPAGFACNSFST